MSAWVMCVLSCFACAEASAAAAEAPDTDVAEVEVTGERPGPNLWRVSNGDHVVWLMGTLDPLPKGITWRSQEIESVLGEVKQLVPSRPDVDVDAGPITLVRTYFQWRRVKKIQGKETLKDCRPANLGEPTTPQFPKSCFSSWKLSMARRTAARATTVWSSA